MYKFLRILQFWCKLNTRRIIETCPLHFLRDYYDDPLDIMFHLFLLVSLRFPRVFLLLLLSVSPISFFRFWVEILPFENFWCTKFVHIMLFESRFLQLFIQITGCPVTAHLNIQNLKQIQLIFCTTLQKFIQVWTYFE